MPSLPVLKHYNIGTLKSINPLTQGFIHNSYRINTARGAYVLQRLHPKLSAPGFTRSYRAVSRLLKKNGLPTQEVVPDKKGRLALTYRNRFWRLLTFVPGTIMARVSTTADAQLLGGALGRFHQAIRALPEHLLSPMRMHETEKVLARLRAAIKRYSSLPEYPAIASQITTINKSLPRLLLPRAFPRRRIHGDTKISNFVILRDGNATMIDLDTCGKNTPLVDIGEALGGDAQVGSWCTTPGNPPEIRLNLFRAALRGYREAAPNFLSAKEWPKIVPVMKMIVLELAARFAVDYFEDSYFGWDARRYPTRRAHNFARVNAQLELYRVISRQEPDLQKIVRQVFSAPGRKPKYKAP